MKLLIALFFSLSSIAFAENTLIPTCDLNKNEESFKKMSTSELSKKAAIFVKRMDNCDAAGALLEVYHRGIANESKAVLLDNLFTSLKRGKFLNEYTALLMGHQHEIKFLNLEKISEDHASLYLKFLTGEGRSPLSQFYTSGKPLKLMDEAEVNFRFFIKNFPQNKLVPTLKKKIITLQNVKLKAEIDYVKFYENTPMNSDIFTNEFESLVKTMAKAKESKYVEEGQNLLLHLLSKTNYSSEKKEQLSASLKKSNVDFLNLVDASEKNKLELNSNHGLEHFLQEKGDDNVVFIPLDDQFKLKASQVLIGLGVVGVLVVFDESINSFVLKNKDAGILDEVASFGNHFGEPSGIAPLLLGTLAVGLVFDNDHAKNAAFATMGALALTQLVVETMKYSVDRSRPEVGAGAHDFKGPFGGNSGRASFPSGHSAAAWSIATIFAQEYGDDYKWAPAVAYTVAAMTSYARLNLNKHWASDVVLGAMIGYVSGRIMHKVFKKVFKNKADNIVISPMVGNETGLMVTITEKVYANLKKWPLDNFYHYQQTVLSELKKDPAQLDEIYESVYL